MHGADLEDEQEGKEQLTSFKFGACSPGVSALLLLALLLACCSPCNPSRPGQEFSFAPRVLRTH